MHARVSRPTLRLLGVGGAFSRRYGTTCSLLTVNENEKWLLDCGRQAPDQLMQEGISWHDIWGQIITHVHGDHVYGMEDFAFVRYFESRGMIRAVSRGGPRPKLVAHRAVAAELWECLAPSLRYLQDEHGTHASGTLEHYFESVAAKSFEPPVANPWHHSETFELGQLQLVARESRHIPGKPSCSLELHLRWTQGSDLHSEPHLAWWSGDCVVDVDYLCEIGEKASIMFHDCTFSSSAQVVHGHIDRIAELPSFVRNKMVLMHHDDDIENHRQKIEGLGMRLAMPGDEFDLISGKKNQ